jgi:1-acyl-sn-glycerol-3-phosphate acyltransferase
MQQNSIRRLIAGLARTALALTARLVTAVRGIWEGIEPVPDHRVYFANHTSNADTILIWTVLPPDLRNRTRPVAAADYWLTSPLRRFIGRDVLNSVLIERNPERRTDDPVTQMAEALDEGNSLILFPEGTRNTTDAQLLPFKTGLYHLGCQRKDIDLVPVWVCNLNHVLPKGHFVPIPLICTVTFGAPLRVGEDEPKDAFLARAHEALASLGREENA